MKDQSIIIIDEIGDNFNHLNNVLKDYFTLNRANNFEEFISIYNTTKDNVVLIIVNLDQLATEEAKRFISMKNSGALGKLSFVTVNESSSNESERLAYSLGASDTIKKPFNLDYIILKKINILVDIYNYQNDLQKILKAQAKKIYQQATKLIEQNNMLNKLNTNLIESISTVVEWRDWETGKHVKRIRCFTNSLLTYVYNNLPQYTISKQDIEIISMAATTHDLGKIAIPDAILLKPGKLTKEEFDVMKTHTVKGYEMMGSFNEMDVNNYLLYCKDICLYHHEKWDGKGYPYGLKGSEIPIWAQVVSIADCFDALVSDRPYKKAFTPEKAAEMIFNGECGAFSPELLQAFKQTLPEFMNLAKVYKE